MTTGEITEDHSTGDDSGFLMSEQVTAGLRVLRRRWLVIVIVPVLAVAASLGVTATSAKRYTATAKLDLFPTNEVTSLLAPGSQPTPADPERDENTEVSQITETPVANMVRTSLRLIETTQSLLQQTSAALEGTTNIVDISVEDPSPTRAARLATAFATQYVIYSTAQERLPLAQAVSTDQRDLAKLTPAQQISAPGLQYTKNELALQAALATLTPDAQVTENATAPSSPSSPRPLLDAAIALVVGLLIAIVAAIVMELFDRTLRDEEDAAAAARLRTLGVIPRPHVRTVHSHGGHPHGPHGPALRDIGPPAALARRFADETLTSDVVPARATAFSSPDWERDESYSSLAISLLSLRLGPEENVLMITSAGPQDGKTSVTLGLAPALAELGYSVIAVECDLRRPRFAEYLGLAPSGEGLSSLLAGTIKVPAGLVDIAIDRNRPPAARLPTRARATKNSTTAVARASSNFTILPCGPVPTNPLALLAGAKLPPLLRQLRAMADIVLIDTPPLGVIKDAVVLTAMVDQVAIVARIGHTRRDALTHCRAAIAEIGSPMAGVVIVGGARGGTLSYYGRAASGSATAALHGPTIVPTPEPLLEDPAEPHAEPPEEPAMHAEPITLSEPKAQREPAQRAEPQPTAAGKRSRPRRQRGDSTVG